MGGSYPLFIALALAGLASAQHTVSFATQDGGLLYGDVYGQGDRAVLLAHGGRFDRASWNQQANILASAGFRALAIDFRGEGKSRGGTAGASSEDGRSFDVLGAVHYLRETGKLRQRYRCKYGRRLRG